MRFLFLCLLAFFLSTPLYAATRAAYPTAPVPLTASDKAALARVETYLSHIRSIVAEFTQTSPDGDSSSGSFTLERPGKLRMEYAPPTPILLVARNGMITYYDKQLDQVSHVSLESTLVGFLAREDVRFDDTVVITRLEHVPGVLRIGLVQAKRPHDGMLTLEFSDSPMALRNMMVTNSAGDVTTVSLNNARFNLPLDESRFVFKDPHPDRRSVVK